MQPQPKPTPSRTLGAPPRTPLASCLALALSLSAPSSAIMAGNEGADPRAPVALRASKVSIGALDPAEVFANIQAWRADHPRPQPSAITAPGSTLVVTNCNNEGDGSLRKAVKSAVSGDIVDMSSLRCFNVGLSTHIRILQDDLTLRGRIVSGVPRPSILLSNNSTSSTGLLVHYGAGTLKVDSLTLELGTVGLPVGSRLVSGGCVYSKGNVTIASSRVTSCKADAWFQNTARGGAIFALGMVLLINSVVSSNTASSEYATSTGGGVFAVGGFRSEHSAVLYNEATSILLPQYQYGSYAGGAFSSGSTIVLGSTIAGNSALLGGGLVARAGAKDIVIRSSTISLNSSYYRPALALPTGGSISVIDATVTGNTISHSGEFYAGAAGLRIYGTPISAVVSNSIVSGNTGDLYDFSVDAGIAVSGNYNLLGEHAGDTPTHIHKVDTRIGPLADNGGPTPTHAIGTGSWAFNRGQTPQTHDQRYMPRPVGTGDDIGAFESDALFIGRFEEPPMHLAQ